MPFGIKIPIVDDAANALAKAAQDAAAAAAKVAQDAAATAEKAAQDAATAAAKAAQDAAATAEKAAQDAAATAEKAVQDAAATAEKAAQDAAATAEKARKDTEVALGKASNDTVAQVGRSYEDTVQLAETSYHFIRNQVDGINQSITDASKRIEEGKLADAIWHVMTDPARLTEQSAAEAVMESSLLNSLAAAGAAAYGGPAGAAAYAAWYTYKATGSLEAALRAGAIAWATSSAGKAVQTIDGTGFDVAAKRVAASAAIGGASVAASGGSDDQVLAAFGRGALVGTAREVYSGVTKQQAEGKAPTKEPVLKGDPAVRAAYKALNNGNLDITSMPRDISHVGLETGNAEPGYFAPDETAGVMQDLAKLPYVNDMAYFHDQWMNLTETEGVAVQVTILPAIVLTGAASDPALTQPGTQAVVEKEKEQGNGNG